jgi:hypothetical protein
VADLKRKLETIADCLDLMESDPALQRAFGGGADPRWIEELEAGRVWPEPPITNVAVEGPTPEHRISGCAVEGLQRANAWALWHSRRAEQRGLVNGAGHLVRIARTLANIRYIVECRGIRASTPWLAVAIADDAITVAEHEWEDNGCRAFARDQLDELYRSHFATLLRVTIPATADRLWQLHEGYMDASEAQISALEALAHAPGYPMAEEAA